MTVEYVDLADVGSCRQRVLIHAKSGWIRKVRAQLAHELEDTRILGVACDGKSSLEGSVCNERPRGAERRRVALSEERSPTSSSRT